MSNCNLTNFLFYFHFFIHSNLFYFEILLNFINYGHLVDTNNEFFIDHQITFKNKQTKIIFNFDDNYIDHPWKKSFGIIKWSGNSESCVPDLMKIDNISMKILESGKLSYILNNLKQTKNNRVDENFSISQVLLSDILKETSDYIKEMNYILSKPIRSNDNMINMDHFFLNFPIILNNNDKKGLNELQKLNEEIKSIVKLLIII